MAGVELQPLGPVGRQQQQTVLAAAKIPPPMVPEFGQDFLRLLFGQRV